MDPEVNRTIKKYRGNLQRMGIHPSRVILFGSHARGNTNADSDLDLLIIAPEFESLDLWERMGLLGRARVNITRPMEILGLTPDEANDPELNSFLKHEVLEKGLQVA
ncbi:MAG: nucleotidyltransferase domain-containing protein [Actinobacteria bacterium]|nr:nucleotidyltransferase domain-containing protein [Actinomycetota bacterium]